MSGPRVLYQLGLRSTPAGNKWPFLVGDILYYYHKLYVTEFMAEKFGLQGVLGEYLGAARQEAERKKLQRCRQERWHQRIVQGVPTPLLTWIFIGMLRAGGWVEDPLEEGTTTVEILEKNKFKLKKYGFLI